MNCWEGYHYYYPHHQHSLPHVIIHPHQHFLVLYPLSLPAFPQKVESCLLSMAGLCTEAEATCSSFIFNLPLLASIFLLVFKHARVPLNSPQMLPFSSLFPQPQSHFFPSFHQHICPKNRLCLLTPLPDLPLTPQPTLICLLPPLLWCNGTFTGLSKCPPTSYILLSPPGASRSVDPQ